MDKDQAIGIAKRYKKLVAEKLPVKALYIYGSYSKGTYNENSVVVDKLSDNYFDDTPVLWKLRRKISNLIEPILLIEDNNNPLYCDIMKTGTLI